ncbi:MAG: single-stranded DNA-binding protein [Acetobacteraceae bacterium]
MSGYLNEATLIGNLGQDPEARTMQNGGRVVTLSVATSESWTDSQSGERKQRTEWHRVVIFNEGLGKIAEKYLEKGAKVLVRGALRTRKWQDQAGADRYSTEIHLSPYNGTLTFLSSKKDGERAPDGSAAREPAMASAGGSTGGVPRGGSDLDDEIPFAPCWQ